MCAPVPSEVITSDRAWERLRERVAARWPEHKPFVDRCVAGCTSAARVTTARNAELIERLAGDDVDRMIDGYRWMCDMVLEEELEFRRLGHYRHSTFEAAAQAVYANTPVMEKYMSGLLLSQVLWPNHVSIFDFYARTYLAALRPGGRHLEIGPGHGLLLFHAAELASADVVGWDVSPTSLRHTAACLSRLGAKGQVALEERDLFAPVASDDVGRFGSVVISEVLEHLEAPRAALETVRKVLAPGGRAFVNAPVNSPALDHIYLFGTPEELIEMVRGVGFEVESVHIAPAAGYPETRARKQRLAISVALVARA
jgi:2-polyprenyl-3-methyl-5-hydroxy-6-metoxy-1,4-benzoquinol methylase